MAEKRTNERHVGETPGEWADRVVGRIEAQGADEDRGRVPAVWHRFRPLVWGEVVQVIETLDAEASSLVQHVRRLVGEVESVQRTADERARQITELEAVSERRRVELREEAGKACTYQARTDRQQVELDRLRRLVDVYRETSAIPPLEAERIAALEDDPAEGLSPIPGRNVQDSPEPDHDDPDEDPQTDEGAVPFVDSPLLRAKRRAFDHPTQTNLDRLIDEARVEGRESAAEPEDEVDSIDRAMQATADEPEDEGDRETQLDRITNTVHRCENLIERLVGLRDGKGAPIQPEQVTVRTSVAEDPVPPEVLEGIMAGFRKRTEGAFLRGRTPFDCGPFVVPSDRTRRDLQAAELEHERQRRRSVEVLAAERLELIELEAAEGGKLRREVERLRGLAGRRNGQIAAGAEAGEKQRVRICNLERDLLDARNVAQTRGADRRKAEAGLRKARRQVEECERDHPPEPEYLAWVAAGKPDGGELACARAEVRDLERAHESIAGELRKAGEQHARTCERLQHERAQALDRVATLERAAEQRSEWNRTQSLEVGRLAGLVDSERARAERLRDERDLVEQARQIARDERDHEATAAEDARQDVGRHSRRAAELEGYLASCRDYTAPVDRIVDHALGARS